MMLEIATISHGASSSLLYDIYHIAISVLHLNGESASLHKMRRHLRHMDHPLNLLRHPLQLGCERSEVEGKGEVVGEVVVDLVELVSEVVVD